MNDQTASPEQLERELAQTRAAIDHKLMQLQRHLEPRRIAAQAARSFGDQGGMFVRNLAVTLRDNPIPTILLAVGLCWLMVAARNGQVPAEIASAPHEPAPREPATPEPAIPEPAAAPRTAAALAAAETSGQGAAAQAARGAAAERGATDRPRPVAAARRR